MGDDVVEFPQIGGDVEKVTLLQLDVGEAERRDELPPELDRPGRELDPRTARMGKPVGDCDEVAAGPASELQHAAALDRGRLQAVHPGIGRDAIRMRVLPGAAGIEDALLER